MSNETLMMSLGGELGGVLNCTDNWGLGEAGSKRPGLMLGFWNASRNS